MSAGPQTVAPSGRKKAIGNRSFAIGDAAKPPAALGHEAQETSSPEEAKEIGPLPNAWQTVPFGEVVDILDSRRIPVNNEERAKRVGDVPYYGATGQVGFIDRHIFDEELVLLGEDGAPFLDSGKPKAYLIRGKSWVNNHAHVLRGKPGLLNSFLLYQLNNLDYRPYVSGTTRLKLPQGPMKRIPLLVPNEKEQRRIVAEIEKQFTRLEAGVAALRRVQANLKRYRAAVLKAASEGKLVPTEAELARVGRVPPRGVRPSAENAGSGDAAYNAVPYETGEKLLQRILAERRNNWLARQSLGGGGTVRGKYKEPLAPDTANLPRLPEGWTWAGTEQLTAGIDNAITIGPFGSNLMVKDYRESGVPLVFVREIRSENFRRADTRFVSREKALELVSHKVRGGDVVITKMGEPPGDTAIYPEGLPDAIATSDCIKLTPNLASTTAAFLKYAIRGRTVKAQIERITRGVAQKKMSLARFKTVCIPLPPLAEQTRIVAEVERRLSMVEELQAVVSVNLQRTTRLHQSILQRAFPGSI